MRKEGEKGECGKKHAKKALQHLPPLKEPQATRPIHVLGTPDDCRISLLSALTSYSLLANDRAKLRAQEKATVTSKKKKEISVSVHSNNFWPVLEQHV